ncbi:MAG TPA: hypothetical protein VF026_32295 [Ktedonobacteraceae bacterium]
MFITSASRLPALVSHAHHKMLVVACWTQTIRVERIMRRGGPQGRPGAKTAWLSEVDDVLGENRRNRTHTRF